jgi:uncharacterized protein (UPF0333 family)
MKKIYSKKGQSILEYVIVLTAIVGVIIWAAAPGGPIYKAVGKSMSNAQTAVENSSTKLLTK